MQISTVPNVDVSYLDDVLLNGKRLKLLESRVYDSIPHDHLRLWCHKNARYGLPTKEVIDFISKKIAGRCAIEIGSGYGDLGFHLGIPLTDSRLQEDPLIKAYYDSIKHPVIEYPDDVEKLEAMDAVHKYKPEVVVASWVTEWIDPDAYPDRPGSVFGVKETILLDHVGTYLLVGNLSVHGKKKILEKDHDVFEFPHIRSKSVNSDSERIWIFSRK